MILLWMSTALALPVGPGEKYETILEALAQEPDGPLSLELTPGYTSADESPFGSEIGIVIDRDLVLSSDLEGDTRKAPPMLVKGCTVTLKDIELVKVANFAYLDSANASFSNSSYSARLLIEEGTLTATNLVIQEAGGSNRNAISAFDSTVWIDGAQILAGDYSPGSRTDAEYAVSLSHTAGGGGSLTLINTTIENARGGGIYVDARSVFQELKLDQVSITNTLTESPGSALRTAGQSTVTSAGLSILSAGNTAVYLAEGAHSLRGGSIMECEGGDGGAFYLAGGSELFVDAMTIDDCLANTGGLAYMPELARIELLNVRAVNVSATKAAGIYAKESQVEIRGGSYCGFDSRTGGAFQTDRELDISGATFQLIDGGVQSTSGGTLRFVNNTFVDLGPILDGIPGSLEFTNNALVQVSPFSLGVEIQDDPLRYTFVDPVSNDGLGETLPGLGAVFADDALFVSSFDPDQCGTEPAPAPGSPLINAGDPGLFDADGTVSDIGALPGPPEDADPDPEPEPLPEAADLRLSGGCGGGFQGAFMLLPLLGLGRRRGERPA